jgi:hypothetical protein
MSDGRARGLPPQVMFIWVFTSCTPPASTHPYEMQGVARTATPDRAQMHVDASTRTDAVLGADGRRFDPGRPDQHVGFARSGPAAAARPDAASTARLVPSSRSASRGARLLPPGDSSRRDQARKTIDPEHVGFARSIPRTSGQGRKSTPGDGPEPLKPNGTPKDQTLISCRWSPAGRRAPTSILECHAAAFEAR